MQRWPHGEDGRGVTPTARMRRGWQKGKELMGSGTNGDESAAAYICRWVKSEARPVRSGGGGKVKRQLTAGPVEGRMRDWGGVGGGQRPMGQISESGPATSDMACRCQRGGE